MGIPLLPVSPFVGISLVLLNNLTPETKLLKTGRKIALGRKDRPLLVNNKKISRDHCEFSVGPCTQDDVVRAQGSEYCVTNCVCVSGQPIIRPYAGDIQCKGETNVDRPGRSSHHREPLFLMPTQVW